MIRVLKKEPVALELFQHRGGSTSGYSSRGRVIEVTGALIVSHGLVASIGDVCEIDCDGSERPVFAEVVGVRHENLLLMPLGETDGLQPGCEVTSTGGPWPMRVGNGLKDRIIDGLGNPIDGRGPLPLDFPTSGEQPQKLLQPEPIRQAFQTGIKAIDAFAPVGRGQQIAILGAPATGKTTLLGMIARQSDADVNVIALIGNRSHEVRAFVERDLGADGTKKSVVIVSNSSHPALARVKAALLAKSIAQDFFRRGQKVLLMIDSLTHVADAHREIGLAIGEPLAPDGYPASVSSLLSQFLNRCGASSAEASVTSFFTVATEEAQSANPISDLVRTSVDGEVVLNHELALQSHYPAIDLLASSSRLSRDLLDSKQLALVAQVREALAIYRKHEDAICTGSISPTASPALLQAIRIHAALQGFLRQDLEDRLCASESWKSLAEALGSAQEANQPQSQNSNP